MGQPKCPTTKTRKIGLIAGEPRDNVAAVGGRTNLENVKFKFYVFERLKRKVHDLSDSMVWWNG